MSTSRVTVGVANLATSAHALYRFYDRTDVLLYVGITVDLPTRMKNHRKGKPWWTAVAHVKVEQYETREQALAAEREAIKNEHPLYNDQHNEVLVIEDEALELAESALRNLDDDEREDTLADAASDFDGRTRNQRAQIIEAAESAVVSLAWDRWQLKDALLYLFEHLPEGQWARCHDAGQVKLGDRATADGVRDVLATVDELRLEHAHEYLGGLDAEERAEWLLCAANNRSGSSADMQVIWAGNYARGWKQNRWRPERVCTGYGFAGAACAEAPVAKVWVANCEHCADDQYHSACQAHLDQAVAGKLNSKGHPIVVDRHEPWQPDVWDF